MADRARGAGTRTASLIAATFVWPLLSWAQLGTSTTPGAQIPAPATASAPLAATTGQAKPSPRPVPVGASGAPVKAAAAAVPEGPVWAKLTAVQREALAPLERDWSGIGAQHKAKWLEVAARFPAMPEAERLRIQQRMTEWARLTPAERLRARLAFLDTKQLSPEEKQARWEAYKALPEDQRKALVAKGKRSDDDLARPVRSAASGASAPVSAATARAATPASAALIKPVSPGLVQSKPGATTVLLNKAPTPPAHQNGPGQPRVVAKGNDVDPATLLPRSGPQAASATSVTSHP